jgi:hypothetical protein
MLLLFGAYVEHNANSLPAPWAGRNLLTIKEDRHHTKSEQEMLQENQTVLIKFCLNQRKDIAWKFSGNKKTGQLGWQVGKLDSLWIASVSYVSTFNSGTSSSYKVYQGTPKGEKRKETIRIHHYAILQLFHLKFYRIDNVVFHHNNMSFFVCQFTPQEEQEYTNLYHVFPRYNWLWLGENNEN